MQNNLAEFYNSRAGRLAKKLIADEIKKIWQQIPSSEIIGLYGFAEEYLNAFPPECKRIILCPHQNISANAVKVDEKKLPLRDAELDRIFIIHALENSEVIDIPIPEIWRVLKPSGKIIFVIPNKKGLWKNKFGGKNIHKEEVKIVLLFNKFSLIKFRRGLFIPPFLPFEFLQRICKILFRPICGVFIFEVEKLIYAPRGRTIKIIPSLWEIITKRGLRPATQ